MEKESILVSHPQVVDWTDRMVVMVAEDSSQACSCCDHNSSTQASDCDGLAERVGREQDVPDDDHTIDRGNQRVGPEQHRER